MKKKHKDAKKRFKWKHFSGEMIVWLVRWYCRYALSYNDLKEMAQARGLFLERSTIFRCVQEYSPEISKRAKAYFKPTCDYWKLDETYVKVKGVWHYLYRAIDKEGNTLDWMLSRQRNKKAAKRFFKKTLGNPHVKTPRVINVDKSPTFPPALAELQAANEYPEETKLRQIKYLNNAMENEHKGTKNKIRYRQSFHSFDTAKITIDGIETLRMIQKGQVSGIAKGNIKAQNTFIFSLFNLAV